MSFGFSKIYFNGFVLIKIGMHVLFLSTFGITFFDRSYLMQDEQTPPNPGSTQERVNFQWTSSHKKKRRAPPLTSVFMPSSNGSLAMSGTHERTDSESKGCPAASSTGGAPGELASQALQLKRQGVFACPACVCNTVYDLLVEVMSE